MSININTPPPENFFPPQYGAYVYYPDNLSPKEIHEAKRLLCHSIRATQLSLRKKAKRIRFLVTPGYFHRGEVRTVISWKADMVGDDNSWLSGKPVGAPHV